MKYLSRITLALLLLFVGYACTDLTEELNDTFTEDFEPNNPGYNDTEDIPSPVPNDGLGEAYSRVLSGTAWHGSYFSVAEISTDEVVITQKGGDWFDGGVWLNMHRHDFLPTNPGLLGAWNDIYGGVNQCNDLLANGNLNANQTAQIRTLRAFFFWKLMDLFGNIKLTTTPGVDVPQSTRAEAFDFIETEILESIPDLGVDNGYSRLNEYAAYALLARLYLNAEVYTGTPRWEDAIDAADMVINSGMYSLDPNYADVFAYDNVENEEHIFIAPFDAETGGGMNFAQMTLHYPSQLTYNLQEQPWNGYSTLEDFYNSYEDGDVRKEANFIAGPQTDLNGNPILDVAFDKADPDGAPVNYTPYINELAPNGSRQAGARLGKFNFKIGQGNDMDNDYTLLRYADVLLMKAEAVARLNNNWSHPTTLALVNQIRERAGVAPYTTLDADEFLAERGREMFQESLRRTDLIRFGKWGDAWWEKPAHNDSYKNIMPIPQDQINASQNSDYPLTQNPGY